MNEQAVSSLLVFGASFIWVLLLACFSFYRERRSLNEQLNNSNLEMVEWHRRATEAEERLPDPSETKLDQAAIQNLHEQLKTTILQGEEWKNRALAAEVLKPDPSEKERDQATIQHLRVRGKEAVRQRDQWEHNAKDCLAMNQRLRERVKTTVRQKDEWEQRATEAEARAQKPSNHSAYNGQPDTRFDELRRFLAREFHPDQFAEGTLEKIVRAEVFKKVWPQINKISGGR